MTTRYTFLAAAILVAIADILRSIMQRGRVRRMKILSGIAISLLFLANICAHAEDVFPGAGWGTVKSEEAAGWSSAGLKRADDFAASLQTNAYLVVQHGVIVHTWGAVKRPVNLHSIRKSVLDVLMGLYVDKGQVDISKTLHDLGIDDRGGLSDMERQATVQHLLQARSGIYHPAAYEPEEMKMTRPGRGSAKPGEKWFYNNWDFNALGTVFKKFTGKTVFESLRDDLAAPLQFEDFSYTFNTDWVYEDVSEHPAYVISLSARDLARVGLLMMRNGKWQDRQFLSQRWVTESTTSYSDAGNGIGYGYLWWLSTRNIHFNNKFSGKVYSGRGSQGQFLLVDPADDLIVVHNVNDAPRQPRNVSTPQFAQLLTLIMAARLAPDSSSSPQASP
jgi:CubicO group peptidase (beta-lactamase class C family)